MAIDSVSGDLIAGGRDAREDRFGAGIASRLCVFSQAGQYQSQVAFGQLGAGNEGIRSVATDGAGNVLAAGSENLGSGEMWAIRKYSAGGASLLWSRGFPGATYFVASRANAVAADATGIAAAGYENRPVWGGLNWRLAKYDAAGTLLWSVSFAGTGTDAANSVKFDSTGNICVAGSEDKSGSGEGLDWLVRKYDSTGVLLWSRTHTGPAGGDDIAWSIDVDGSDNIYAAGEEGRDDAGQGQNWLLVKYDSSGNVLWSRSFNGAADGADIARAVAVNAADGSVAVGGETENPGRGLDWLIRKYDSSGNLLFGSEYDSPVSGDDSVHGLAVDGSGNILAGGYAASSGSWISPTWRRRRAWLLRKYGPTGNLLWSADAPIGRQDSANSIGVDFRNWAWVAGRDVRPGRGQDVLVQVYSMTQTGRVICASLYDYSRGNEGPPSIYLGLSYCSSAARRSETILNYTSDANLPVPSTQMTMLAIEGAFVTIDNSYNERLGVGENVTAGDVVRLGDNSRIGLGTVNANGVDQLFAVRERTNYGSCNPVDRITATYWSGSTEGIYGRAVAPAVLGGFWAAAEQGGDLVLFKYSPTTYTESGPGDLRAFPEPGYPKRLVTANADMPRAAAIDQAGNLWVAGSIDSSGAIWKFADSGSLVPGFPRTFPAASSMVLSDIVIDDRGNALATGYAGGAGVLLGVDPSGNPLSGMEQGLLFTEGQDSLQASGIGVEPGGPVWVAGTLTAGISSTLWTGSMSVLYRFSYLAPAPGVAPGTVRLESPGGAVINLLRGERLVLLAHPTGGGIMHFRVMTMRGEPVWEYTLVTPGNQTETFIWDGVNSAGRPVTSGAYAVRIYGAGLDEILRAVVIKR